MKEYDILYTTADGEEFFIVKHSFWKALLWFLCTVRRCIRIVITVSGMAAATPEDPCDTCLRWDECNGVERGQCVQ